MIIWIPEGQLWALYGVSDEKSAISFDTFQPQVLVRPQQM